MLLVSELTIYDFFIHELKLPEIKARQYVEKFKHVDEKLQIEIREGITRKFDEHKEDFILVKDKDALLTKEFAMAMFATKADKVDVERAKNETIKWTVATIIACSCLIVALIKLL